MVFYLQKEKKNSSLVFNDHSFLLFLVCVSKKQSRLLIRIEDWGFFLLEKKFFSWNIYGILYVIVYI